ncbi:MAG TPA: single-stranded-DNA-specific exonuclease RecJ [Armatimonadetes bacterium]|nr:single-stranded-DNA-specific exonuclease RecJ [Armatimonadota bacterium]
MAPIRSSDWIIRPRDRAAEEELSRQLGLHPILSAVLLGRGLGEPSHAERFLSPSLDDLHDPFLLPDMEQAVDRLLRALREKEPILVHGDYDADGITATTLLVRFLSKLGADVHYYLPHRFHDCYGLSQRAVRQSADVAGLIIATDCGVRDHEAVACACDQGQDVIIVDHHEPGEALPARALVINPKRQDAVYPDRELAAVGLAFKLASAICERLDLPQKSLQRAFLDLVAIGTITDICPLVGENRAMTAVGLQLLPYTRKVGLQILMELCEIGECVTAQDIGYRIGPRLNAVGRMADPTDALELLLTEDENEARRIALHLDSLNSQRRTEQDTIFRQALKMVEDEVDLDHDRVIVLAKQGWHRGVVGIVASKVLEQIGLPTLLMAVEGTTARGSARSIGAFDVSEALNCCSDLLDRHGGHSMAAGFESKADRVAELRERLNEIGRDVLDEDDLRPTVLVDAEVTLAEVDTDLVRQLERLQPCGAENPDPLFVTRDVTVMQARTVGAGGTHLKLAVESGGRQAECIGFGLGNQLEDAHAGSHIDLCFVPDVDHYTGVERLQLRVTELRRAY